MNSYSSFHPIVLLIYFVSVTLLTMFTMNPIFLALSFLGGLCYLKVLSYGKEFKNSILLYLIIIVLISGTNPFFGHNGNTVLFNIGKFFVTEESLIYGLAAATMIVSVICWFSCMNFVLTSEKFVYLFGKAIPKLSLVLSMALRFVPTFKEQITTLDKAQKTLGLYASNSIKDRIFGGTRVFSAIISWSLENAVVTADSMKARGYGLKNRSNYSIFKFTRRDGIMISFIVSILVFVILSIYNNNTAFLYYPKISRLKTDFFATFTYTLFLILMFLPFLYEVKENIKWKYLKSKI